MVKIGWDDCSLNALSSRPGQPLQKLYDMQSSEGNDDGRWIVGKLYEDVHEDQLAQEEEVVEDRAHSEEKRGNAQEESYYCTASEKVEQVSCA